jgi:hypothetical protein
MVLPLPIFRIVVSFFISHPFNMPIGKDYIATLVVPGIKVAIIGSAASPSGRA